MRNLEASNVDEEIVLTRQRNSGPPKKKAEGPVIEVRRCGHRRFSWTPELIELLGKKTDAAVGRKAGISPGAVRSERLRRGIPTFKEPTPATEWSSDMIALLGTDSDTRVAAALGVTKQVVKRKRQSLGIPACYTQWSRPREWSKAEIELLGTRPDWEVAEALGLSIPTVQLKRSALGIPAFHPQAPPIVWTEEMDSLLGTMDDSKVARKLGISPQSIGSRRKALKIPAVQVGGQIVYSAELISVLHLPSAEVRQRTGLPNGTIQKLREELGIPNPEAPPADRWNPEVLGRLGTVPDAVIAKELGITDVAVGYMRRKHGIPAFRKPPRSR